MLKTVNIEQNLVFSNLENNVNLLENKVNLEKTGTVWKLNNENRKSKGPEIEPWVTPQSSERHSGTSFINATHF